MLDEQKDDIQTFIDNISQFLDNSSLDQVRKLSNAKRELKTLLGAKYSKQENHFNLLLPTLHEIVKLNLNCEILPDDFEEPYTLLQKSSYYEQLADEQRIQFHQEIVTNLLKNFLYPAVYISSIFHLTKAQYLIEGLAEGNTKQIGYALFQKCYFSQLEFLLEQIVKSHSADAMKLNRLWSELNDLEKQKLDYEYQNRTTSWIKTHRLNLIEQLEEALESQERIKQCEVFQGGYQFGQILQFKQQYELARDFYDLLLEKLPDDLTIFPDLRSIGEAIKKARPHYAKPLNNPLIITKCISINYQSKLKAIRISFQQALMTQKPSDTQRAYSQDILSLMGEIANDCKTKLGEPPCSFTLIGMGSISRLELNPASDIDAAILIDKEGHKENAYFKAFVRLLQYSLYLLGDDWQLVGNAKQSLGLHIDNNDYEELLKPDSTLIQPPKAMAEWVMTKLCETKNYKQTGNDKHYALVYGLQTPCFIYSNQADQPLLDDYRRALDSLYTTTDASKMFTYRSIGDNTLRIHQEEVIKTIDRLQAITVKQALSFLTYWCFDVALTAGACPWKKSWFPDLLLALSAQCNIRTGYLHYLKAVWEELHTLRLRPNPATERVKTLWQEAIRPAYDCLEQLESQPYPVDAHIDFITRQIDACLASKTEEKPLLARLVKLDDYLGNYPSEDKVLLKLSQDTCTALLKQAINQCLPYAVKALLSSGADVNATDSLKLTVLHHFAIACIRYQEQDKAYKLAEILLNAKGVIVNSADQSGNTSLYYLLRYVDNTVSEAFITKVVKLFIQNGAELEYLNPLSRRTLLESSMIDKHVAAFCLLASLGAGSKAEASSLLAFIESDKHKNNQLYQKKLQKAQQRLAQQNSLFAWHLSLRRLTQDKPPTAKEIKEHCKGFYKNFNFEIEGALSGKCYLCPHVARVIFDDEGNPRRENTEHGLRAVAFYQDNDIAAHFKFYPELPGIEEAVQVLYQLILGDNPSTSKLFRFVDMNSSGYPVLISQHVPGVKAEAAHHGNVQELFNHYKNEPEEINAYFDNLDSKSFSELLLLTILTNPEDGKPDNLVLQPYINTQGQKCYRLVSVDNDHALGMPLIKKDNGDIELQVKTLVYCVNQMQEALHPDVIDKFLKLDPVSVIREWLIRLEDRQKRYEALFAKEKQALLERGIGLIGRLRNNEQPVIIPIVFARKSAVHVYEKFLTLQMLLKSERAITGIELLRRTLPFAAGNYIEGVKEAEAKYPIVTPVHRFRHTASALYLGKKPDESSYGTSKTSYQFMLSLNIPLKEIASYSPTQALQEFEAAQEEAVILSAIKQELNKKGCQENTPKTWGLFLALVFNKLFKSRVEDSVFNESNKNQKSYEDKFEAFIARFNQIQRDSTKEEIIQRLPFKAFPAKYQRKFIDDAVKLMSFTHLSISHSQALTDADLKIILTGSLNLVSLTLNHCNELTQDFLAYLSKAYKTLEQLTLCDLSYLQSILVVRSVREFRLNDSPLILPQLHELTLINLLQLHDLDLEAPQLKKLQVESCPKITQTQVHKLILSTPQVESLMIEHCPQLNIKALLSLLLCQRQQWTVSHIKPFIEGDTLNLQGLPITDTSLTIITERQLPCRQLDLRGCNLITREGLLVLMRHASMMQVKQTDYAAKEPSIATLTGHTSAVWALLVFPDGRVVSGSTDNTLRVWDVSARQSIATLTGHTNSVTALLVFPDGRVVSGSTDNTLRVWDISARQGIATLTGHTSAVWALLVLPDGRVVSGSHDNTLRVWDISARQCIAVLTGHTSAVRALLVFPDGRVVSGSYDNTLRVWDISTRQSIATLTGHTDSVTALLVLPDGRVVSGSLDATLRVWDVSARQSIATLTGHTDSVYALLVLPDGRVVSGSTDNTLRVWDISARQCIATLTGHTSGVNALLVLPDGRVVSGSNDNTLRVWDVSARQCIATLTGHTSVVTALLALPDGRVVSGSVDNTLRVWDISARQCIATLTGHTSYVMALLVLPDGCVVSGSRDKTLRVWDISTRQSIATLTGHTDWVRALLVLPDGRLVSGSDDKTLRVWDISTRQCIATLTGHTSYVWALLVLSDGRVVSGSEDKTLRVWDISTRQSIATLTGHTSAVYTLLVLSDGRVVSGSGDKTLRVWDTGIKQLSLLLLECIRPQIIVQGKQLVVNLDTPLSLEGEGWGERAADIFRSLIQLCFGLAPATAAEEPKPLRLSYTCTDAKQATDIQTFLQQVWQNRQAASVAASQSSTNDSANRMAVPPASRLSFFTSKAPPTRIIGSLTTTALSPQSSKGNH